MLTKIRDGWGHLSPRLRMTIRTLVIGGVVYFAQDLSDGDLDDWEGLWLSLKVSASYAILGLLTPLEPFVGVGKPDRVEVPAPPAVKETP